MIRKEGSVSAIGFRLLLFLDLLAMFRQKVVLHQLFYVVVLGVEDLLFYERVCMALGAWPKPLLSLGSGSFLFLVIQRAHAVLFFSKVFVYVQPLRRAYCGN